MHAGWKESGGKQLMTAGRDMHRLLWAVGEARRLRRAESSTPVAAERPGGEGDDGPREKPSGRTAR
jgi:hypothetical protein